MGAPSALRPRLTASLPFAPKHWQIHHLPFIGLSASYLIPEIGAAWSEKLDGLYGRPADLTKTDESRRLTDVFVEAEHRQVHRDHDESNDAADEDDHQRLDQRGERFDLGVDLGLVEVGDLAEHVFELPGLLADGNHVADHRRKDRMAFDRPGQ